MLIAGRFFAGIGVGMISTMIPLYQSETAPKWIRGVIIGAYQWAITIGLLLAAVVNNTTKKAACSLGRIRRLPSDHPAVEAELAEIQTSYNHEKSLGEASWLDCFRTPSAETPQLSGVNFIFTNWHRALGTASG
ncbi:hypothetical protein BKA60DRAFT_592322 [Fusarium oxysporum]|nr:hypothetical protein BKA60DRAFT_592322 [Fusarium oxysporum]